MPSPLRARCEEILGDVLGLLSSTYGIDCDLSCEELLGYLSGPTYEKDAIGAEEALSDELLLLHEVAETCILKSMGYRIGRDTVVESRQHTYSAHLRAMDIELSEALKRKNPKHIRRRCKDLNSYLYDPYLPSNLVDKVHELIFKYCWFHT